MSCTEGKSQTATFDFAVTSKTTKETVIGYTVSLEKLEPDTGYTFLNDSDIKIYIEDYNGNVVLEKPKTKYQNFVHMCDFLASKKFLLVPFNDNNEIEE